MTQLSCEDFLVGLPAKPPLRAAAGRRRPSWARAGVALGNMVGISPPAKRNTAAVEEEILALNARAETLRKRLEALVQADADAFTPLAAAYACPERRPTAGPQRPLCWPRRWTGPAPCRWTSWNACCEGIRLAADYAEKGSVLAVSDAGCAALFCKAALQASALNVAINTKLMTDRAHAAALDEKAARMLAEYVPLADEVLPVREQAACGPDPEKGNVYVYHFEGCARRGRHERSKCRPLRRSCGQKGDRSPRWAVVRWVSATMTSPTRKASWPAVAKVGVGGEAVPSAADASQEEAAARHCRASTQTPPSTAVCSSAPCPNSLMTGPSAPHSRPEKDIDGITDGSSGRCLHQHCRRLPRPAPRRPVLRS